MKITAISDTHTKHKQVTSSLSGGDVLIHCGDFMSSGYNIVEVYTFLDWLQEQDYTHKIFIAGNHDRYFEDNPKEIQAILKNYNVIYLQDSEVIIDGIKFYGTPWTPEFMGWGFPLPLDDDNVAIDCMNKIPNDTDVLISHGPAHMIRDYIHGENVGCKHLAKRLVEITPQYHVFGHIHEGYGSTLTNNGKTVHLNVSVLNGQYNYTNKPINFEIDNDT